MKHDRVSSLRVKNCPVSESEWASILEAFFNQEPLDEINAAAAVQSESSIAITIRKQVQGITVRCSAALINSSRSLHFSSQQRLGSITLSHDENEAIELLEWCATSADAVVTSKDAASRAEAKARELETTVNDLKAQLDELVKAKADDETVLLQKFRDLLNEKKIKIREQQKVLAATSFQEPNNAEAAEPEQEPEPVTAPTRRGRKPTASRAGKRKAAASAPKEESEEEIAADEPRVKSEPEETDGHSTEDTASTAGEDSDEEMGDDATAAAPAQEPSSEPQSTGADKKSVQRPPPKRDLPFMNRKTATASKPVATRASAAAANEETDSDDDELYVEEGYKHHKYLK